MRVLCASDDREMILRVMQHELHDAASYHPLPSFSYSVGGCTLLRDGFIEVGAGGERVLPALAVLGLCEFPFVPAPPEQGDLVFRMSGHNGTSLRRAAADAFQLLCPGGIPQHQRKHRLGHPQQIPAGNPASEYGHPAGL